jgi:hypothetical protein
MNAEILPENFIVDFFDDFPIFENNSKLGHFEPERYNVKIQKLGEVIKNKK